MLNKKKENFSLTNILKSFKILIIVMHYCSYSFHQLSPMNQKNFVVYFLIVLFFTFIFYYYAINSFSFPSLKYNSGDNEKLLHTVDERLLWVTSLERIVTPVLMNMAEGKLQSLLSNIRKEGSSTACFEAIARTLDGIAPWLELPDDGSPESKIRERLLKLAHCALEQGVDSSSSDSVINLKGKQPLVEYAYLCQAFLRSPKRLWGGLKPEIKSKWISSMKLSRPIKPFNNNWLLFAGEVEAFLWNETGEYNSKRLRIGPETFMDSWFVGEGAYKDGPEYHFDYYNSYVIHPMLLDILTVQARRENSTDNLNKLKIEKNRGLLYARFLERLIAPDGSYPIFGRSICCRMGVFHQLADVALRREKLDNVSPGQIRSALTAVIRRQVIDRNFRNDGFLKMGFNGEQPEVCEGYFNYGSLYHTTLIFLPLGLPPDDTFWTEPTKQWTSKKAWDGQPFINDH